MKVTEKIKELSNRGELLRAQELAAFTRELSEIESAIMDYHLYRNILKQISPSNPNVVGIALTVNNFKKRLCNFFMAAIDAEDSEKLDQISRAVSFW